MLARPHSSPAQDPQHLWDLKTGNKLKLHNQLTNVTRSSVCESVERKGEKTFYSPVMKLCIRQKRAGCVLEYLHVQMEDNYLWWFYTVKYRRLNLLPVLSCFAGRAVYISSIKTSGYKRFKILLLTLSLLRMPSPIKVKNKQHHSKVLLNNSFQMKGHTLGFCPLNQKFEDFASPKVLLWESNG